MSTSRSRPLPPALAATLCLQMAAPAFADATAPEPRSMTPVVVTAVMQENPLTVITDPKQPRQPVPASDGADLLKSIPGFSTIRKGGSNGDPVLRGMGGSRLNILADGGQIAGGCPARMDPPTAYISPQSYDRVTVIKGPESVVYGPGSSAGTVLFEREFERYAKPAWSGELSALGGSAGRNDQNLDLRAGGPQGYLGLSANRTHAQDYRDGDGRRVHSRYDRWNADATLGWTPDEDTRVELAVGQGNGQAAYAFSGMDGARFLRESVALKASRQHLSAHWNKLEAQLYMNHVDHVMDNYTLRDPDPFGMMPMAMATEVDRRVYGGRIAGTWNWADALELEAGVDGSSSVHESRSGGPRGSKMGYYAAQPRTRDARMQGLGAFAESHWIFAPRQRLVGGARIDQARVRGYALLTRDPQPGAPTSLASDRSALLASGFLRYERDMAQAPVTFYAGLGHAERFPDYWELFGRHTDRSVPAFQALRPERTTQLDMGLQYRTSPFKAWVSAYVGVVNDFILMHYPAHAMGSGQASNVRAQIAGGEAGASYALNKHWKADVSLAYAWGRNQTERRPLPQMPPLEARLGLGYETASWSAGALWRLVHAQRRVAVGEGGIVGQDLGPSGGFGVFSLNAAWRIDQYVSFSAGVDNLFNKVYAEALNAAPVAIASYANSVRVNEPGRTFWGKLDVKW